MEIRIIEVLLYLEIHTNNDACICTFARDHLGITLHNYYVKYGAI